MDAPSKLCDTVPTLALERMLCQSEDIVNQ